MTDAIELLALPALACVALVGIHAYFGIHVLQRNVIFVDLALAQVAALGATIAFLLGYPAQGPHAYAFALAATLAAAALLAATRAWSGRIPQEAQIGVIYVVAAAAALVLVDRAPQGAEHIRQILTGNILTVGASDLAWAVPLYLVVGVLHPIAQHSVERFSPWWREFVFYAAFGVVVTSSVALAGVLLVFAFLIIPAAVGVLCAERFRTQLVVAWVVGTIVALIGLTASYAFDLSTGATLVCAYGLALPVAALARLLRDAEGRRSLPKVLRMSRWIMAVLLALSAGWMAASPRADQPLLDLFERIVPAARELYFDERAEAIVADAERYRTRYREESARLRGMEAERRWKGEPMEETEVRRVASFLKSYNEMIQGESFAIHEVRARAREANRWWLAASLFVLSALLAPLPWRARP